jgi:multimeric flavodoxin WrbA
MASKGTVLGLVGSPNVNARTNELVTAALEGASKAGAQVELLQLSKHVVNACKDCAAQSCAVEQKCRFDDAEFEYVSGKILSCGALVLGAPVYWWDTTGMVKYLILRMFRVHNRMGPLNGLPAVGIGVAGGTGNGLVSGLRPIYHFFQMSQMRALAPIPVTRFNYADAIRQAGGAGQQLAALSGEKKSFVGVEDRLLWYDSLPYLGLGRAGERELLASLIVIALPAGADPSIARGLARAGAFFASGQPAEGMVELSQVIQEGTKAFEAR